MLQSKIQNKISQIRAQMIESGEIIKHRKTFIKNLNHRLDINQELQIMQSALDLLDSGVIWKTLLIFFDKMNNLEEMMLVMMK